MHQCEYHDAVFVFPIVYWKAGDAQDALASDGAGNQCGY